MTYAQWRRDGFDVQFVASKVSEVVSPLPTGGLRYSGEALFEHPFTLLETGIEFLEPISDADRSWVITHALEAALRSANYGPNVLIREINKAARDFFQSPEQHYVVVTTLSFNHFEDITRMGASEPRIYVRHKLPQRFKASHREARERSRLALSAEYPGLSPSTRYAPTWIHVRGRSAAETMNRASEALDLRRGIWNFALNRRVGVPFPPPNIGPLNEVRAGPLYSLHYRDGSLAAEVDWIDQQYTGPRSSRKLSQKWEKVRADEDGVRRLLKRSPYRPLLEESLKRYCQALNVADLSRSFLELWSLLEALTGIAPDEGHDKVVRRASFVFAEKQRKTHEQVLQHLRRHRNSYIHAGEGSDQIGAYVHQLRGYVEEMLTFHLQRSPRFSSLDEVTQFLDMPPDPRDIRRLVETRDSEVQKATEAARIAREGLQFREGS